MCVLLRACIRVSVRSHCVVCFPSLLPFLEMFFVGFFNLFFKTNINIEKVPVNEKVTETAYNFLWNLAWLEL